MDDETWEGDIWRQKVVGLFVPTLAGSGVIAGKNWGEVLSLDHLKRAQAGVI